MMARPNPFRAAILTIVAIAIAIGVGQALVAQSLSGHNGNAPVNYAADRIDTASEPFDYVLASGDTLDADAIRASVKKRQPGLY